MVPPTGAMAIVSARPVSLSLRRRPGRRPGPIPAPPRKAAGRMAPPLRRKSRSSACQSCRDCGRPFSLTGQI